MSKERFRGRPRSSRLVLTVYLMLRLMVIYVLISQLVKAHYENVYICILTLVLFMLPSFIERRLHVDLPDMLEIIILLFIFAAQIMGEIQSYYLTIPCWDLILHTINGFLFAAIGFSLINILNEDKRVSLTLSPLYMALTAFCFSMTIGVLWEFFEWVMDILFGFDMQKDSVVTAFSSVTLNPQGRNEAFKVYNLAETVLIFEDGSALSLGLEGYLDLGLYDTMMDLLVNFLGAVVFSFIGFFYVKTKGRGFIARLFIPEPMQPQPDRQNKYR